MIFKTTRQSLLEEIDRMKEDRKEAFTREIATLQSLVRATGEICNLKGDAKALLKRIDGLKDDIIDRDDTIEMLEETVRVLEQRILNSKIYNADPVTLG